MHAKRHATLARLLIEACGGLEASADSCRLKYSQLQRFTDEKSRQFMPADVIDDLESKCGRKIYSGALFDGRSGETADDLVEETFELSELSLTIQRFVRMAKGDGVIDAQEQNTIDRFVEQLGQQVRKIEAANERGRT